MKERLLVILERYLLGLARVILSIYKPLTIGISGSVGNTTTKEAIAHVLIENKLPVLKTEGNLNADLGIALTVLGYDHSPAIWEWPGALIITHLNWLAMVLRLKPLPKYFVVEMGIDRIGDMTRMLKTVHPNIGVITWIGEGHHLEYLKDTETIAKEKGQLLAALPKMGLAIIPATDPQTKTLESLTKATVVKVQATGEESIKEIVEAIGDYLKLDKKRIDAAIETFQPPKGRFQILKGINGSTLIDDSYNSSVPAAKLALQKLAKQPGKRKIAVLGDLLEQGEYEAKNHTLIADLAKKDADIFIGVGKRFKTTNPTQWYASPDEAATALKKQINKDDVILIKGSQGMRMEKISAALAADAEEAKQKLPRQTVRWQQIPFGNP